MNNFTTIDEYLAALPAERRAIFEKLRRDIHTIVPGAEECISYAMPAFRSHGAVFIGFAAAAAHNAVYPFSGSIVAACAKDLTGYSTSKSAVRFPKDQEFPVPQLHTLIRARLEEIARRGK